MARIDHDQRLARNLQRNGLRPAHIARGCIRKGLRRHGIKIDDDAVRLVLVFARQHEFAHHCCGLSKVQHQARSRRRAVGIAIAGHHAIAVACPGFRCQPVDRPADARQVHNHAVGAGGQQEHMILQGRVALDHDAGGIALPAKPYGRYAASGRIGDGA